MRRTLLCGWQRGRPNESLVGEVGFNELSARIQTNNSKAAQTLVHTLYAVKGFLQLANLEGKNVTPLGLLSINV